MASEAGLREKMAEFLKNGERITDRLEARSCPERSVARLDREAMVSAIAWMGAARDLLEERAR